MHRYICLSTVHVYDRYICLSIYQDITTFSGLTGKENKVGIIGKVEKWMKRDNKVKVLLTWRVVPLEMLGWLGLVSREDPSHELKRNKHLDSHCQN